MTSKHEPPQLAVSPTETFKGFEDIYKIDPRTSQKKKSHFLRNRWKLFFALGVLLISLAVASYFVATRVILADSDTYENTKGGGGNNPNNNNPNNGNPNNNNPSGGNKTDGNDAKVYPSTTKYDSSGIPILPALDPSFLSQDKSTFDDSHSPNPNVPPLNQPFPYDQQKIHGVSLGGWLVLEPLITPSLFNASIQDEWTLCTTLGPDAAKAVLDKHYDTFVTEDDFAQMAKVGLDHVRIPMPFWAVEVLEGEPYVPLLSWQYLLRGINWARKHGIRVLVDLHAVPGCQNGWNHCGHVGTPKWLDGTKQGQDYGDRTLRILKGMANFFAQPDYIHAVPVMDPVNEPDITEIKGDLVKTFYQDSYNTIRSAYSGGQEPYVIFDFAFYPLADWKGFQSSSPRKMLDIHLYMVFAADVFGRTPANTNLVFPCVGWASAIAQSQRDFGPTIVGEWVGTFDDCAVNLNGVGNTPRYQGACPNCTCAGENDWQSWSQEKKNYLLALAEAQMDAFENGQGWFFWTWKTENNVNPKWNYQLGSQQGWLPADATKRSTTCADLMRQYPDAAKHWS